MLSEVVSYPVQTRALLIREPLIDICEGAPNANCAGVILSSFEYWTRTKTASNEQAKIHNEIAAKGGMQADQDTELWIYKTAEDLVQDILGLFSDKTVRDNLTWLVEKKFLHRRNNPRFAWDRTYQYLFNAEFVQAQINLLHPVTLPEHSVGLPNQSGMDTDAIPKTTSKTTSRERTSGSSKDSPVDDPADAQKEVGRGKQSPSQDSLFALPETVDTPVVPESTKKKRQPKSKEPKQVSRLFTTEVKEQLLPIFFKYSFRLDYKTMSPAEKGKMIGRFVPTLSALQPLDDEKNITVEELVSAYRDFRESYPKASYPAGEDTIPKMLVTYRATHRRPTASAQSALQYEYVPFKSDIANVRPAIVRKPDQELDF